MQQKRLRQAEALSLLFDLVFYAFMAFPRTLRRLFSE